MGFETGIYEQIINRIISERLEKLPESRYYTQESKLDKAEAAKHLSNYLATIIQFALSEVKDADRPLRQIHLSNKIIEVLAVEMQNLHLSENLIDDEGRILEAVFSKVNFPHSDIQKRVKEIMPYTRLSHSELFSGNNVGISLDSEIRKEIQSADEIDWLVSFIKYSGVVLFKNELEEFASQGKKLRVITTSYIGATDAKAVEYLASLPNAEVKVSYNEAAERLHAKAYLFKRNSGFHTGYIGSSNMSRSALTKGLEWNLKITTKEIPHIIDKFQKTFDTYWEDHSFESYQAGTDLKRLQATLKRHKSSGQVPIISFFDIQPRSFQKELLRQLEVERSQHGRYRNLVVAATGTGKTVVSAFDFKRFLKTKPQAKLLYVAHRKEILEQALSLFQGVLRNANFGALMVDGIVPERYDHLFASVQSLGTRLPELQFTPDYYDFIIIDEVHHISASSYRPILSRFTPEILLGLTATPERMDGQNILSDFCDVIAAEMRLPEALNEKLLTPFNYFALSDRVDISKISWRNGKYDVGELEKLFTEDDRRVGDIIHNCNIYLTDVAEVRTLGFCVSRAHASFMAAKFNRAGLKADFLTSDNASSRAVIREKLTKKVINYLFVVDIFNEGVDIPEIDTVLFLRPTESLTVFLQQLGRGLRLAEGKDLLTVLDFVGNARPEYDFEQKFRALVGKTHTPITKEIEDDFPHLPLGCSIILEKKAKKVILDNIRAATDFGKRQLIRKIQNFRHHFNVPLTFKNFLELNNIPLPFIYKNSCWHRLCAQAGVIKDFNEPNEVELTRCMSTKLIACDSYSYLSFLSNFIGTAFDMRGFSEEEMLMALMFHYDVWSVAGTKLGFSNLSAAFEQLLKNPILLGELRAFIAYKLQNLSVMEKDINFGFPNPLRVHGRYTREQILVAIRLSSFKKASSNREGVAVQMMFNIEALFVTLKKSDKDYSPTTLYDDYALSDEIFHWQSQNSASPDTPKGQSYISQSTTGKKILLFIREQNQDEFGNTMGYVFLGDANYMRHSGAKPMSIEWALAVPIPEYLMKESKKLGLG
jgi:superfamily II DNA or RNA helicase